MSGAVCPDTWWNEEERNTGEKCSRYKMNYSKQVNSNLSTAWNSVLQILTAWWLSVQKCQMTYFFDSEKVKKEINICKEMEFQNVSHPLVHLMW